MSYPNFSKLKSILSRIHILLTPDRGDSKVFENIPVISLKKEKSFKDILVEAKVRSIKTEEGFFSLYSKPRCETCKHITKTLESESFSSVYIPSGNSI